jgi:hypothetical protein
MFFATHLRRELSRGMRQAIFIALAQVLAESAAVGVAGATAGVGLEFVGAAIIATSRRRHPRSSVLTPAPRPVRRRAQADLC